MTVTQQETQRITANTIRGLAIDAIQKANSGHPGLPMGMADVASVLWLRHLRYSLRDTHWPGRDRFVLSAGHGSMLQYALLHLAGYPISIDDLKQFRQLNSKTPGHPEVEHTAGVEITTGPLGSGFASGVGMALGARMEAARFENPQYENRVVGIISDGDLMEGISNEAASLAGHLALANLVYFYDDNSITIEGETNLAFSEDVATRFRGLGWRVLRTDGHDYEQITTVMDEAFAVADKPTLVICKTHIGYGSPNKQDSASVHGAPLGDEEIVLTRVALGLPAESFHVPDEVRTLFAARAEENETARRAWLDAVLEVEGGNADLARQHSAFRCREIPEGFLDDLVTAAGTDAGATRGISGKVIQTAAERVPSLVGGSADLDPSCKTRIKSSTSISRDDYAGRNFHFGIREHAMGAILNGLALHGGYLPMGSTFLVFADYMRASIRLAAIMKLRVGFIFTHDSLMVGEDGPTHQPVEQISALRLIPNLHVWRPADGAEVGAAWHATLTRSDGPTAICLTRQSVPNIDRPADFTNEDMTTGGYVIHDSDGAVATVIATGSEVAVVIDAANQLAAKGEPVRVISMPCVELFRSQPADYRRRILGTLPTLAVEMGVSDLWCQFTGDIDRVIGIDHFGSSAPGKVLADHFGFTSDHLTRRLSQLI